MELTRTAVTELTGNAWKFSLKFKCLFHGPLAKKAFVLLHTRLLPFLVQKKHLLINSQVSQIQVIKEQTRGCLGCVEADYILLGWTGVVSGREPIGGSHPTISHDGRVSIHQPPWIFQDTDEYKQNAWERLRKRKGPRHVIVFFSRGNFRWVEKTGPDIFSG